MTLREEIARRGFIDGDGLITPRPCLALEHNVSGNGLLYTAEYLIWMIYAKEYQPVIDRAYWFSVAGECLVEPGLLKRSPTHPDQQGPDDYIGAAAASYFIDQGLLAKTILEYGRTHPARWKGLPVHYVYNNVKPGEFSSSAWLGRQPALIAHLQFCAGETPALWRQLAWAAAILMAKPESQDDWVLSSLLVMVAGDRTWVTRQASRRWKENFKQAWPGGLKQVLTAYFNLQEAHPLATWAPGFWT